MPLVGGNVLYFTFAARLDDVAAALGRIVAVDATGRRELFVRGRAEARSRSAAVGQHDTEDDRADESAGADARKQAPLVQPERLKRLPAPTA